MKVSKSTYYTVEEFTVVFGPGLEEKNAFLDLTEGGRILDIKATKCKGYPHGTRKAWIRKMVRK